MGNPSLSTLADSFMGTVINTALWSNITGGTATLDTVNDLVVLQQPTVNGAVNTFGSTSLFDATGSAIYAEVGPSANGNGGTRTTFKLTLDANNSVAMRLQAGAFVMTLQTAGTTVTTTLATYDPNAHGWWRLRESAGSWNAETSADGLNWATLLTSAYTWSALALTFVFQTAATVTEAAGNVATIQHVNTMLGGPININWPVLEEAYAPFWNCNGGDVPLDRYLSVTARTRQQSSATRGRQYELDQVRAGEASLVLANLDGVLDPGNASGPLFGHIMPYQPYRRRGQWPPTRNLLSQTQATAGVLGGQALGTINPGNTGPSIFSTTDSGYGSFVSSATAWSGNVCMQFAVTTGASIPSSICYTPQVAVEPGATYSHSVQVRNVTATTTVPVQAALRWLNASGGFISTSTGSPSTLTGGTAPAWTPLTVTATAPANAAYMYVSVFLQGAASANCAVQVDGWQLEKAAAPSTWACPGVWFPIFGGFVERWPETWDMNGTYGTVQPTAVDGMALLSQRILTDPLTHEINSHNPRFVYTLGDPSGSSYAADQTGNNPPAPVANAINGAGSLTFGNQITATNPATGVYIGSSGSVVTINNSNPGSGVLSPATYINLAAAGIVGPPSFSGVFTRMIAFRYTGPLPPGSGQAIIWSQMDNSKGSGNWLWLLVSPAGTLQLWTGGPTGSSVVFTFPSGGAVMDGNWHLASFVFNSLAVTVCLDGVSVGYGALAANQVPSHVTSDSLGNYVDPSQAGLAYWNFKGDISFAAEFPSALSGSDMSVLYNAWKSSFSGESTDTRYSRILRYAGYIGISSVQSGQTRSMGPAAFGGQDALSALQSVVDAENGEHFADRAGTVTFRSRGARYNALTPVYVLGERTDLGEWPYEVVATDFDSTHLSNLVTITQASSNQLFTAQDATSQTNYFPRSLQRTINASDPLECQSAAQYLLSRYKNAATRISSLVLHPAANPAMWPMCLALELGMRIRVMRRPPRAPAIQVDCFVENLQWGMDNQGDATLTLQCSPVDSTPYGIYASFHTSLASTIASGVGSVTLNAGSDNTNLAAAQLGQGQQLVLGQNTATQETVTIKAVAATSPGWSTVVVTLTANTTKSHTAGDVVCEPLPTGVTDPTTWDATAVFDSVAFSY